jgi:hypothetical protein
MSMTPCWQVLVLLETEEVVAERWRPVQRPGSGVIRKARTDALPLWRQLAAAEQGSVWLRQLATLDTKAC